MMTQEISYKLEQFEGPLDLLLHLIEKEKINIYDIPIADITEQYLTYMNQMERPDLDVMSEFLVMAAQLLEIKARMLLPREVDPETGEEIDPRQELVERLIAHKRYKAMAAELSDLLEDASSRMYKEPTVPEEVAEYTAPVDLDSLLDGVTLKSLQEIFAQVMKRSRDRVDPVRSEFGKIKKEKVSLENKLGSLIRYTSSHKKFSFRHLLEEQPTKTEIIVTFLAVLELTKIGRLHISQDHTGADLQIEAVEMPEGSQDIAEELDLSGLEDFEG
jgi:segregation and condensation protein A